ncbi:hypothetical protein B0H14DRAFT_2759493, partial [Mycena olivaceomarginata]
YSIEPAPNLYDRLTGNFVKSYDYGDVKLRLAAQDDKLDLPVYSGVSTVEGTVEIANTNNISSVQVKVMSYMTQLLPLPPSHSVKLKRIPGFNAILAYSISAKINKTTIIHVSTPFIYYPRTHPPSPLPFPMYCMEAGIFEEQPAWNAYQSIAKTNPKSGVQDIGVKLCLPASRIFCIPFHITMESDAHSLAAFLPYAPVAGKSGLQFLTARGERSDTAIWRVDYIGEAAFRNARDSPSRMSFSGDHNRTHQRYGVRCAWPHGSRLHSVDSDSARRHEGAVLWHSRKSYR